MTYLELEEILLEDKPSDTLKKREEELFELIPKLGACKGFDQHNKEWHPYDVLEHIYRVVDGVELLKEGLTEEDKKKLLTLRLTALFHDIGKCDTYKEDENGIGHFYNHWVVSQEIFLQFAQAHNIDEETKNLVSKLIYYHDLSVEGIESISASFTDSELLLLFNIKRADILAQNQSKHEEYLERYANALEGLLIGRGR